MSLEIRQLSANQERWALVLLLLLAFALRVVMLDEVPVGLRYDELQNHMMAGRVMAGERPLYFSESWGHEPLYHYFQAAALTWFGESGWSLRLPSVFLGVLEVAATWLVARKLFGQRVGLLAAAFLTVSFWGIFYSRIGSRVGSTTFFVALMVYFLWQTYRPDLRKQWHGWLMALVGGLLMGTAVYLYVAGRVTFGIFAGFVVYLAIFHWHDFRQRWLRFLLFGVVGVLVAAPLFIELRQQPALEQRLDLLNQPLEALKQGDPLPVLDLSARALGMYVLQGEQDWLYNVSGRPIFDVLTAVFFLLGIGLVLWRWRQVRYALLLVWLLMGTSPAMLAPPEASLTHTIAAQPVAFILLALGVGLVWGWLDRRQPVLGLALAVGLFVFFTVHSAIAYFGTWTNNEAVRELYQGGITAVADAIVEREQEGAIAIGAPYISYWHPWNAVSFDLAMSEDVSKVRWFNPAGAWVWPQAAEATFYFPTAPLAEQQFDPTLETFFFEQARPLAVEDDFVAFRLSTSAGLDDKLVAVERETAVSFPPDLADLSVPELPVNFGNRLQLLAVEPLQNQAKPGEMLRFVTYWQVLQADAAPLVAFTHLTGDGFDIWGQQDWFDVRMDGLQTGDRFAQVHQVTVNPETLAGAYHFQIGLYNPQSLQRLPVVLDDSATRADRIWVGEATIDE